MGCVVERRDVDQGWAWVVLLASFLANALIFGVVLSFGIYFVIFQEQFGESKAATAWIGSISAGSLLLVGSVLCFLHQAPFASMLNERFGCRMVIMAGGVISSIGFVGSAYAQDFYHLYFTYGVLTGVGFGLAYTPAVVAVGYYFDKRRDLATALCVCGGGVGTVIFAPLYQYLLQEYGWRGSLLLNAGFSLHLCVCGALIRPYEMPAQALHAADTGDSGDMQEDPTVPAPPRTVCPFWMRKFVITDYRLAIYMLNNFLWIVGCYIVFVLICDYVVYRDYNHEHGALLLSTFGVSNTVGRVAAGLLGSMKSVDKLWLYNLSTILMGVATLIYPGARSYLLLSLIQAVFGIFFGIVLGSLANVTTELFGIKQLSVSYGYLMFSHGIGCLLGPPLAGSLYDSTHNYSTIFFLAGAIMLAGAMLFFILMYREKKRFKQDPNILQTDREKQSLILTFCTHSL